MNKENESQIAVWLPIEFVSDFEKFCNDVNAEFQNSKIYQYQVIKAAIILAKENKEKIVKILKQ